MLAGPVVVIAVAMVHLNLVQLLFNNNPSNESVAIYHFRTLFHAVQFTSHAGTPSHQSYATCIVVRTDVPPPADTAIGSQEEQTGTLFQSGLPLPEDDAGTSCRTEHPAVETAAIAIADSMQASETTNSVVSEPVDLLTSTVLARSEDDFAKFESEFELSLLLNEPEAIVRTTQTSDQASLEIATASTLDSDSDVVGSAKELPAKEGLMIGAATVVSDLEAAYFLELPPAEARLGVEVAMMVADSELIDSDDLSTTTVLIRSKDEDNFKQLERKRELSLLLDELEAITKDLSVKEGLEIAAAAGGVASVVGDSELIDCAELFENKVKIVESVEDRASLVDSNSTEATIREAEYRPPSSPQPRLYLNKSMAKMLLGPIFKFIDTWSDIFCMITLVTGFLLPVFFATARQTHREITTDLRSYFTSMSTTPPTVYPNALTKARSIQPEDVTYIPPHQRASRLMTLDQTNFSSEDHDTAQPAPIELSKRVPRWRQVQYQHFSRFLENIPCPTGGEVQISTNSAADLASDWRKRGRQSLAFPACFDTKTHRHPNSISHFPVRSQRVSTPSQEPSSAPYRSVSGGGDLSSSRIQRISSGPLHEAEHWHTTSSHAGGVDIAGLSQEFQGTATNAGTTSVKVKKRMSLPAMVSRTDALPHLLHSQRSSPRLGLRFTIERGFEKVKSIDDKENVQAQEAYITVTNSIQGAAYTAIDSGAP